MKHILVTLCLLLGAANLFAQSDAKTRKDSLYRQEVREMIALDYSMPDYSVNIQFLDGVSESKNVNDLFSYIGRYVTAREQSNY